MANISSAATGDWNATSSWDGGAVPVAGDLVTILSGHNITLTQNQPTGVVVINSGGTLTGGGFKLTLNDAGGTTFIFSNVGTISGNLDIDITGGSADRPINEAGTGSIRNLTINNAQTYRTHYHLSLSGDLTITSGTFTTNNGSSDQNLTVTGECEVNGGTLTLNGSTVNVGDMKITSGTVNGNTSTINLNTGGGDGWAWFHSGGTWNYNTSTVVYKTNGKHMEGEFYNLTIECASSTHTGVWRADGIASTIMKCANNLTVKEGIWKRDSASETMTIEKNVVIEDGGTLGQTSATGADNFGSLTIENNGTYVATSGTTSITGGASVTTNRCIKVSTNGVYTLNNGTINVTGTDWGGTNYAHLWVPDGFDFGNVTINAGGADAKYYQFREGAGTMNFNDVYCKSGEWRDYNNNNTFNIRGNVDIGTRGAGGTNAVFFSSDARDNANTTKLIVGGLVTNYTNGQFHVPYGTDGTDGCKISGLRNIGGTVYGDTA